MNKKNLLIYPFSREVSPLVRHSHLISDYHISDIVSPKGWGFNNKNAGFIDKVEDNSLTITDNFENSLTMIDTVLFCNYPKDFKLDDVIYEKIKFAIDQKKNIINLLPMENTINENFKHLANKNKLSYVTYETNKAKIDKDLNIQEESLEEIQTPVIFVLGLGELTNKFDIQLALREGILKMDYKVSQVGTKNYCELMGFHSFPNFMFNKNLLEKEKILLFNRFISRIETEENPDVIVIGIPGGIMPINTTFTNNFGILAFEVSQAIKPDAAILSVFYEDFKEEYFNNLNLSATYKLGFSIDCFHLANVKFDWSSSKLEQKMKYITINPYMIEEKKKKISNVEFPLFQVFNKNDRGKIVDCVINKLAYYGEMQVI